MLSSLSLSLFLFFHQPLFFFLNKCSSQNSDQRPHFHQSNACAYPRAQSYGGAAWGLVLNLISLTSFKIGSPLREASWRSRNIRFHIVNHLLLRLWGEACRSCRGDRSIWLGGRCPLSEWHHCSDLVPSTRWIRKCPKVHRYINMSPGFNQICV